MPDDTQTTTTDTTQQGSQTGVPNLDQILNQYNQSQDHTAQGNQPGKQRGHGASGEETGNAIGDALKKIFDALFQAMAMLGMTGATDPNNSNQSLTEAVQANMNKVNQGAVSTLTDAATNQVDPHVRADAMVALGTIIDQKSDKNLGIITPDTVKTITEIAQSDKDSLVHSAALQALEKIAEKRPDLVDKHMLEVLAEAKNPQDRPAVTGVQTDAKGRQYTHDETDEKHARETAQNTLQTVQEKRPDLHLASNNDADHSVHFQLAGLNGFSGQRGQEGQGQDHSGTQHAAQRTKTPSMTMSA